MSRSTFLKTASSFDASETPSLPTTTTTTTTTSDHTHVLRFHHRLMPTISSSSRSNETLPAVLLQSSRMTSELPSNSAAAAAAAPLKSVATLNPKVKRNLRGKRRSTGIRADDVSLASTMGEASLNEGDEEEDNNNNANASSQFMTLTSPEPNESFESTRNSPPKPIFKVSRVQPAFDENSRHSFEKLSINRTDSFPMAPTVPPVVPPSPLISSPAANLFPMPSARIFRPEEFILRRQPSDEESSAFKRRPLDERIFSLEALVYDKDATIYDLQRKLDRTTRDLSDAEQQIYILQRDKLTLIKALTSLQENKPPSVNSGGDPSGASKRTGYHARH